MRRLWLLRHAKSSWDDPGLPDHERPLARRGRKACRAMAAHLADAGVHPGLVVCSSAVRARETLAGVMPGFDPQPEVRHDDDLYTFSAGALLAVVRALPDERDEVLLVGHNPAFEDLASGLAHEGTRLEALRAKYPTCALAGLDLDVARWADAAPGCARLTSFVTPKDLTG